MKVFADARGAAPALACAVLGAALALAVSHGGRSAAAGAPPQDVMGLDRRINSVEQRLFRIESSLNQLERLASMPARTSSPGSDAELGLLRAEVETLRRRLSEVECGLVKLDERTTTAEARASRRRAGGQAADPCRLDAAAPLALPGRP